MAEDCCPPARGGIWFLGRHFPDFSQLTTLQERKPEAQAAIGGTTTLQQGGLSHAKHKSLHRDPENGRWGFPGLCYLLLFPMWLHWKKKSLFSASLSLV